MRRFARVSTGAALLAGLAAITASSLHSSAQQTSDTNAGGAQSTPLSAEPRALYQSLNALRPDPEKVYYVKNLNLHRDVVHLTLVEGKLAFFEVLDGRVTGAVFIGRGHVIATPREAGERRSLAQFLGVPILDQTFSRAYLRFDDDTAADLQRQIQNSGTEATTDREFADSWGPVIANLNPWHSLRLMTDWLSADPLPYFYTALAGDTAGPFDVLVDARRDEQVLFGQPRNENGVQFYDVWASFRATTSEPKEAGNAFVPLDYRVDTTLADDLSLEGKTLLQLKAQRAGERVVPLELSRNLAVEEIKGQDGTPLVYFQNEDMSRREVLRRGNDTVLVILPAPAPKGAEINLEVSYHGSVITDAGNGVEFVGERGTWYAHVAGENFVPFDLTFRWPKRFTLVATGTETESHEDSNSKTGRWKSQVPLAVAGFNLGEYELETAATGNPRIQLFANRQLENAIVARLQQNSETPEAVLPPLLQPPPGSPLPPINPPAPPLPNPASVLKSLGGGVLDAIHYFEGLNGPFPFDQLEISQIPGSFGQGWPGLVYLSTLAFLPPEAQEQAGIRPMEQEEATELMPFHEVAHQWWGNVTGSASYRDDWIQEGMANYLAILYSNSRNPGKHRLNTWLERYRAALLAKAPGSQDIADEAGPLELGIRISSSKMPNAYVTVIYDKGTWVIHMLHEMLRDPAAKDPDERFRELLQSILRDYRFRALSTADFQRAVERVMTPSMDLEGNRSMNWYFDEWVRGTGIPRYSLQFQTKANKQEFVVTGKLEQSEVSEDFTAPVPIYAIRGGEKPDLLGVVVTTGTETHFRFVARFRPSRLLIDPQLTLLRRTN